MTGGTVNNRGYRIFKKGETNHCEHKMIAEKALGKPLPKGAEIHHMNGRKADNHTPFNLIICPSHKYHMLLHKRMRAYIAEHGEWK